MRTAFILTLMLACASLHAGLEPRDEALLQAYLTGELTLPGAVPVGYEHKFEVGDLQEADVLDRGVYRTLRYHIVGVSGEGVICEIHNGRGFVVAGLIDNNGALSKAWVGRAGEKPSEVSFRRNPHMQLLLHDAIRVPWAAELYNLPASSYVDNVTFKVGDTDLTTRVGYYTYAGVEYQATMSHGADNWFGPYWQWQAEDTVLFKVTRREKLARPQPLLDWSDVLASAPKPAAAPAWTAPLQGWTVKDQPDGSMLVFSFESRGEFVFLDADLNPVLDTPRIGPFGRHKIDACSPGPFVIPSGMTAQLQTPNTTNWAELGFLLQQAARTRVSMLVLVGAPAGDRGLKTLKEFSNLEALDLFPMGAELTEDGFKSIAALSNLRELNLTFVDEDRGLELLAPLKNMKSVRKLALRAPELKQIPQPLRSWTGLTSIELTGKDIEGIKSLKGLNSVSLVHSELSRKSAEELVSLPALTNFELHSTLFPPSLLKQLSKLERLNLTADTPDGVTFLIDAAGALKQLRTLEISVARLLGEDLLGLTNSKVETLVINGGLETEEDVAVLAKLKSVRSLTLADIDGFNNTSIRALAAPRTLSKLNVVLSSSKASLKEVGALAALNEFSYLNELHIREGGMRKVQQLGLNKFATLTNLSLEKLNLGGGVTAEIVNCAKLETLSLAGSLLPQNEVAKLANIKTLKVLDLRGCLTVRADEIEAFKTALPGCSVLR